MLHRRALIAASTLVLAASIPLVGASTATGDDGSRQIHFTVTNTLTAATIGQVLNIDTSRCQFGPTGDVTQPCVAPVPHNAGFDDTFNGDLGGTQASADTVGLGTINHITPAALDIPYVIYSRFVGHVTNCGNGSFIIRTDGNGNTTHLDWQIVPNSARGDLTGITGGGTLTTTYNGPAGTTLDYGTGQIRCNNDTHNPGD
jgi:hypothetical protein